MFERARSLFDFTALFSFSTFDSILHFSLLFFFSIPVFAGGFFLVLINYLPDRVLLFIKVSFLINYCFDWSSSYITPPFQYFFLLMSSFFFKAPIHCIEVYTGFSSCYSLYNIHYFSSLQFILFFFTAALSMLFGCLIINSFASLTHSNSFFNYWLSYSSSFYFVLYVHSINLYLYFSGFIVRSFIHFIPFTLFLFILFNFR